MQHPPHIIFTLLSIFALIIGILLFIIYLAWWTWMIMAFGLFILLFAVIFLPGDQGEAKLA